jgi:hypothetical protein
MNDVRYGFHMIALGLGVGVLPCLAGCKIQDGQQGRTHGSVGSPEPVPIARVCQLEDELEPQCDEICSPRHRVSIDRVGVDGCRAAEDGWTTSERAGYCTYKWTRCDGREPTEVLDKEGNSIPTISDCKLIPNQVPIQAPDPFKPDPKMADFLMMRTAAEQYGTIDFTKLSGVTPVPVMVAVVDTAPTQGYDGAPLPNAGALHGLAMASIVRDIACGEIKESECPRTVETFLGLPRWPAKDLEINKSGGHYGHHTDLAQGILDAVNVFNDWKKTPGNEEGKLVINLSVGWERVCGAERPGSMDDAIRKATDAGALVVAAAGNRKPGSCVKGPTAPGSWGEEAIALPNGNNVPRLYAATPVDDDLQDLATFRPLSNTRIAARGFMVVTVDESVTSSRILGPYSGSSVATAVTSGIAALVWSYHPRQTPDQLMDGLWSSGVPRGKPKVQADSYYGMWDNPPQPKPDQHVISACSALQYFECLGKDPQTCPSLGCTEPSGGDNVHQALEQVWTHVITQWAPPREDVEKVRCPSCDGSSKEVTTQTPGQSDPVNMWVVPQPSTPPCNACTLTLNSDETTEPKSEAGLTLATFYQPGYYPLTNTKITVTNSTGSEEHNYGTYGDTVLYAGNRLILVDDDFLRVNGQLTTGATVYMTFTDPDNNNQPFTVSSLLTVQ